MTTVSIKLLHVLMGKALIETVFIGALALLFFVHAFPPHFRGWGEVDGQTIVGWANNGGSPASRVEVQMFIDGGFVAQQTANQFRPDVREAGWALDDWHGYRFELPHLVVGQHQARIYATHSSRYGKRITLQLLGDPIDFVVENDGHIRGLKPKP
jgi:hypothetical protein